jgi:hypothetical protein
MSLKLRVQSHIVGATCFVAVEKHVQPLQEFYSRMFEVCKGRCNVDGSSFVRFLEPSLLEQLDIAEGKRGIFSRPKNHRPIWLPHVAVESTSLVLNHQSHSKLLDTVCTISGDKYDRRGQCIVVTSPELTGGERVPFVIAGTHKNLGVFERSDVAAPFPQQPRIEGVVNWCDVLVEKKENQRKVAALLNQVFGWNIATPITLPGNGEYITLLNDTGDASNRNKICGMLPKGMLLPKLAAEARGPFALAVPFLSCYNKLELEIKCGMAIKHGGELLVPPMNADGDLAVIRDPYGGVVGLYHRTDDWDVVKPTTVIVPPAEIESIEPMPYE